MKHYIKITIFLIIFLANHNVVLAKQHQTAAGCFPAAVYLVRHAEKQQSPGEHDPELSQQGHQRATSLSQILDKVAIDTIFSSEFKRTQQTVAPTALKKVLKVQIRDARAIKKLVAEILNSCNKTILVAGHSNTVPLLLKELGLTFEVKIQGEQLRFDAVVYLNDKEDYGTLFKVTFEANGNRKLSLSVF